MINFHKHAKYTYIFSAILFFGSIGLIWSHGLDYGLDFTGGTLLELKFDQTVETNEARNILAEAAVTLNEGQEVEALQIDFENAVVQSSGEDRVLIRSQYLDPTSHNAVIASFLDKYPDISEERYETVGPIIGASMKSKSKWAIVIAVIFMILYITFAFRRIPQRLNPWKFGTVAVVALIHDVTITTGFYTILSIMYGAEIDLLFVTGILTVFGFSVHDTIVVFDRMRENLKIHGHSKPLAEIGNDSLNQTLSRSINTSFTTLVVIFMLVLFGSKSIFFFSLILLFGIAIGTYSSVFLATPLLVSWLERRIKA